MMKLRALLSWIDDTFRPAHVQGDRTNDRSIDNIDAVTTAASAGATGIGHVAPGGTAPPNWVPSQQDERPRH
jgi:hypothetical protein